LAAYHGPRSCHKHCDRRPSNEHADCLTPQPPKASRRAASEDDPLDAGLVDRPGTRSIVESAAFGSDPLTPSYCGMLRSSRYCSIVLPFRLTLLGSVMMP